MKPLSQPIQLIILRVIILLACLLFFISGINAQTEAPASEVSGEMYGNPYLIREWSDGAIKFTSGRVVKQFRLRFDCVRNQLLLQFQGSTFAAESKVKEFVMYTGPAKNKDSLVFRKGYPAVDKSTEQTYYHVLLEDKVHLLRLISKNIVEEKQLISNQGTRGRLEDDERYYLLKDGNMIFLPAEKEELLKAFPEKADALSAFINEKRLRFKSYQDYTILARKYVELLN